MKQVIDPRTVVVTGDDASPAKAIAQFFASAGDNVTWIGEARAGHSTRDAPGPTLRRVTQDLRDAAQLETVIDRLRDGIDVWINAGIASCKGPAHALAMADWDRHMERALAAVFAACQAAGRHMLSRKRGVILNISRIDGCMHQTGHVAESVSSAGVIALTRALGIEWAPRGVRVAGLTVGTLAFETGIAGKASNRTPLQLPTNQIEIARAAWFLASDEASYIVGESLKIDGGFSAYQLF